jgi:hypothetical protein
MPTIRTERRRRRSNDTHTALGYQLEHIRQEAGLEAIVLADRDGLSLSHAGELDVCSELAALSPIVARQGFVPFGTRFDAGYVHVRSVRIDGHELYLCSCSDSMADVWSARIELGLREAQHGVARILAA